MAKGGSRSSSTTDQSTKVTTETTTNVGDIDVGLQGDDLSVIGNIISNTFDASQHAAHEAFDLAKHAIDREDAPSNGIGGSGANLMFLLGGAVTILALLEYFKK